jgi:hypothetical protein
MNNTTTLLTLLEAAVLGVFEDRIRLTVNLTVSSLNARAECVTSKGLKNTVLFNALE